MASTAENWALVLRALAAKKANSAPAKEDVHAEKVERPRSVKAPRARSAIDDRSEKEKRRKVVYVYVRWTGPFEGISTYTREEAQKSGYAYIGKRKPKRNRLKQPYVMIGKLPVLVSQPDSHGAVFLIYPDEG